MTIDEAYTVIDCLGKVSRDPETFVWFAFDWDHDPDLKGQAPQEWQLEQLRNIGKGLATPNEVIRQAVASGHGIGKAHDVDMVLDTPAGKRRWGDLKPGDTVFTVDGIAKILQCKQYKSVPLYRVYLDDGSFCDVSSGHLWTVKGRKERRMDLGWTTLSTLDILKKGVRRSNGKVQARQWELPGISPVFYPRRKVPVHPYVMGVWLGDGHKGSPTYSKPYPKIAERIRSLGYSLSVGAWGKTRIQNITHLWKMDVFQHHSYERYIPDNYKYNCIECRKELLRGLLDTDGEITKGNSIGYSTTSKRLADDIIWLVRSLGGKAKRQQPLKHGWYYDKSGKRKEGRTCYRLTINVPFNPFTLEHRKERYRNRQKRYLTRWIDRIEPIGNKPAMCITVDRKDGLYLANDFIPTHNSALVSWIILWAISTYPNTRGIVTANTEVQLRTKTWAELAKWYRRFIGKDLFQLTATSIFSIQEGHDRTWRIDAIPWSKENPEAFAGLHNQGSRILLIFDEASAIDDTIWEVAEGALTDRDTQIIWCAFGNPTRNTGRFHDCFTKYRAYWNTKRIDSRSVTISNKQQIKQWENQYGEDSDFFKVRVRGEFPSTAENQFISEQLVADAQKRVLRPAQYNFAPVILGVDMAWSGGDATVIYLRQGLYSKKLASYEKNDNDGVIAGKIAAFEDRYCAQAVFIDQGYGTGVYSFGQTMGRSWRLVAFGSASGKRGYANKRAEMWGNLREWLRDGGVLEDGEVIHDDLIGPEAFVNNKGEIQLEKKEDMKRRGLPSPNEADALALTFAYPVLQDSTRLEMANTKYDLFKKRR